MRQHPAVKRIVSRLATTAALGLSLCGFNGAQALAQDAAPNVARISFVQGSVQLLAGQGTDFQQAVMNMPVVDGSRVQTGADGEAEIEFGDGSVARVTPNSALQFDHLGTDQVQLEQLSGLAYYELNVGEGHAPFGLQLANIEVQPTANSILRVGMDAGWEVAVINGSVSVQGNGIPPVNVAENQSVRSGGDNNGAPYTVAQGINGDSWDNWNQDRDQAIAQEAAQQTPVRDDSANPQSENWNDLDADGNWYPVEGSGNVWVPAGVGADWDPYGAGYWGYYPTLGYTWISAYPWGWLPYHYGSWNYYSFGWGWTPGGGRGRAWSPVIAVHSHPPGWTMPIRPVYPPGGIRPLPGQRLLLVDRGPAAKGPWGFRGAAPRPDHLQALNFRGNTVAPVARVDVHPQSFSTARGTSPGVRSALSGTFPARSQPSSFNNVYTNGPNTPRPAQTVNRPQTMTPPPARSEMQRPAERPNVGYPAVQNYNQRQNYTPREPSPTVHYSPPPSAPHYQPPAQSAPHYQAPPPGPHGGAHR
jgi:hypothetical protein